ncbi:hypothetical protein BKA62DRAFT_702437 [Auriculariales sp. MPI-PUGE-AT-0066]|nr:hypothetical protein BKA62DRAFT_702437 [Auriculariales sp. MPI-PUGE-AT-0066]
MAKTMATFSVHDIRSGAMMDLREEVISGLSKPAGKRNIPTVVLYDEQGLKLYDTITTECKEYYLFGAEEQILRDSAVDVVRAMGVSDERGADVLELGAGALRKTSHILIALASESKGNTTYYALDLEPRELDRTLSEITAPGSHLARELAGRVRVRGLCGTYDDGIHLLKNGGLEQLERPGTQSVACQSEVEAQPGRVMADVQTPRQRASSSSSMSNASADVAGATGSSSSLSDHSGYSTPPTPEASDLNLVDEPTQVDKQLPLHLLFLGSSIGNFPREDAAAFLRSLPLRPGSSDTLLLGLDGRNDPSLVNLAYRDPAEHTEHFIMNGLAAVSRLLGADSMFDVSKWSYESGFNNEVGRHEAYYKCLEDHLVRLTDDSIAKFVQGELVHIENAYKYSDKDAFGLFEDGQLVPLRRWTDSRGLYSLWLLQRPAVFFPILKSLEHGNEAVELSQIPLALEEASGLPFGVPKLADWEAMWKAWDAVTLGMIPPSMLHERPIDLRHICLFYLGHIPAFLDIHISRLLKEAHTEPEYFKDIFERGIDPHVDDPTQCHPHSEVPIAKEDWPSLDEILAFRDRVRARVLALYEDLESGKRPLTHKTARVLAMTLEHEGFHIETLLYMLLQRAGGPEPGTLPPPNTRVPNWTGLRAEWDAASRLTGESKTTKIGPTEFSIGHDDFESTDEDTKPLRVKNWAFGWDNEHPRRSVKLDTTVKMSWRCITNGEYAEFWRVERAAGREVETPKSWVVSHEGNIEVRTLYGPIPLHIAHDWPVLASYDALSKYAMVHGGRLPTENELRLFLDLFHHGSNLNVGFKRWHLLPSTLGTPGTDGKGHNGGTWEWTSTLMNAHEGYKSSHLYPGYSSDFFDDKHHVVLGGSYATIPRIAQRSTVRNFYQHNYPYAWVSARVVYDA